DVMLLAPDLVDIEARNGVIHVIGDVLIPGSFSPSVAVPEPSTLALLAIGALAFTRRHRSLQ
ncbi:MAG: MprA protease, GlyGly-CTERM protein-sorting domain-containing form, partial [Pirellulales bacterium]